MYKKILSIILLGTSLCLFAFSESKALDVSFIQEPVEIDGELDEEFYQHLTAVEDFVRYHPQNGEKPTFKTQVYTFYDKNNIYFSFKFFDDELVWEDILYPSTSTSASISYEGSPLVQFGLWGVLIRDFVYNEEFTGTKQGKFKEASFWTNIKISPQLQLNLSYSKTFYKSLDKTLGFNGDLITSTLNYQVTKRISSFIKFQYDSYLQRFQYDFLIGYEPANVSKVYFSIKNYSEGRLRLFHPDAKSIGFKVSYLIRV